MGGFPQRSASQMKKLPPPPRAFRFKGDPNRAPPDLGGHELEGLRARFRLIDTNKDGLLDRAEAAAFASTYRISLHLMDVAFRIYDTDNDDSLTEGQFIQFISLLKTIQEAPEIFYKKVFDLADPQHTGLLDPKQLRDLLGWMGHPLSEQAALEEIRLSDTTGLGKLTFLDFVRGIHAGD
jgi:Ca2+-binding EF-hand superfamily protein